jgi:glyoxylase-like metal-dependent hydrolase (beta-lactamase superfamily II)/ferredoxin
MALQRLRRKENVAGDFFVDQTCIDCDLCRQIAPLTFTQAGESSAVYQQPETPESELAALKALVTCPTASIGTLAHHDMRQAVAAYPEQVEEEVYFCGFASDASYGASSYLIIRPAGNVLVDSPRFAKPLVKRIEELGGIEWMFLTHRDDVADHAQWAKHFGARRIMHLEDAGRLRSVIERPISGSEAVLLEADLLAVPTPGHTRGHTVLLYRNRFLFSGDHIWWSDTYKSLHASRSVSWYSWPLQIQSVELLLNYEFEWVLPGHGRRVNADSSQMKEYLRECLSRIKPVDSVRSAVL